MNGRKAVFGLCMLCALALSAIVSQGASAATKGTTIFTCAPAAGGAGFSKEHCTKADAVPSGAAFKHVAVAEETTTELTGTSVDTEGHSLQSNLRSVQSGITEELQSTHAHVLLENKGEKSWVTNMKDPTTGEHYITGNAWVRYTGVTVALPAGKGCKVVGGEVTTNKLHFTTKGQGDEIKFEPAVAGQPFAAFNVEGCTGSKALEALNHEYTVTGSLKANADGATLTTTEAGVTAQTTLKTFGQTSGLEGTITVEGTDEIDPDESDTPLSVTTVETP